MRTLALTALSMLAIFSIPQAYASVQGDAAPAQQTVFLVRTDMPKAPVPNGTMVTISPILINTSHPLHKLTVTIALYSAGSLFTQTVLYDQSLVRNVQTPFSFTTMPLPPGSYAVEVLVQDNKGTTLAHFANIGTVVVNP